MRYAQVSGIMTDSKDFVTGSFLLNNSVFALSYFHYFFSVFFVPCGRLSWLPVSFLSHENIVYHIIFCVGYNMVYS